MKVKPGTVCAYLFIKAGRAAIPGVIPCTLPVTVTIFNSAHLSFTFFCNVIIIAP